MNDIGISRDPRPHRKPRLYDRARRRALARERGIRTSQVSVSECLVDDTTGAAPVERFVHHRRGRVDMLLMPSGKRHVDLAGRGGEVGVRSATVRGTPELDLQLRCEDEVDATLRALDPNAYWYVEFKAKGQAQDVNTVVGQLARRALVHDYDGPARKAAVFGTTPSPESFDLLASEATQVLVRP